MHCPEQCVPMLSREMEELLARSPSTCALRTANATADRRLNLEGPLAEPALRHVGCRVRTMREPRVGLSGFGSVGVAVTAVLDGLHIENKR
jgi:hypothetical protein